MDASEIKRKIIEEGKVEDILEALGCEYIKVEQRGNLITAQLPASFGSENKRAVQVYVNEHLPAKIRNLAGFSGDIFSLVAFLKYEAETDKLQHFFKESLNFITDLFGWRSFNSSSLNRKKDFTAPLKKLASKSRGFTEVVPNKVISEKTLNNFMQIADDGWYKEGISLKTQRFYQIGFDFITHRITIPIRNIDGELVGVKGRLIDNRDVSDFNPKYKYLYKCNISQELFNLYVAKEHIMQEKKVFVFESEKSVMKLHSHGIYNAVAIASSDITPVQALLLKSMGVDVDIVLCYDKDKTVDEIKKQAEHITGRNVYGILDLEDLLDEKDAPVDKGMKTWEYLAENNTYPIIIQSK